MPAEGRNSQISYLLIVTIFADSSALVKRYADERGSAAIRAIDEPVVVSGLARVEVPSALWRKARRRELTDEQAAVLVSLFEFDWFGDGVVGPSFTAVHVTPAILDEAAVHVARHDLRAADAIQLASARTARRAEPTADVFSAFDVRLRAAAAIEGFSLMPATIG